MKPKQSILSGDLDALRAAANHCRQTGKSLTFALKDAIDIPVALNVLRDANIRCVASVTLLMTPEAILDEVEPLDPFFSSDDELPELPTDPDIAAIVEATKDMPPPQTHLKSFEEIRAKRQKTTRKYRAKVKAAEANEPKKPPHRPRKYATDEERIEARKQSQREYMQRYYAAHRDEIARQQREYYATHRDEVSRQQKEYHARRKAGVDTK